jgi:DNA integrity scanning protein DisA with diadenylate cyclase activity
MVLTPTLDRLCSNADWCRREVLDAVLTLAREIAREGRRTGALLTIGRSDDVLSRSRPLILDPLSGHPPATRHVTNPDLCGTIKALARLDGACIFSEDGTAVAACRYLDVLAEGVNVPLGFGSRHVAAASISKQLGIVAIAVSETGAVRVFFNGELVTSLEVEAG